MMEFGRAEFLILTFYAGATWAVIASSPTQEIKCRSFRNLQPRVPLAEVEQPLMALPWCH